MKPRIKTRIKRLIWSASFGTIRWLHQFEEFPNYNRFGAGLYQLLWTRWCGYDWANAWDCAAIYWFNRKPKSYGSRKP